MFINDPEINYSIIYVLCFLDFDLFEDATFDFQIYLIFISNEYYIIF